MKGGNVYWRGKPWPMRVCVCFYKVWPLYKNPFRSNCMCLFVTGHSHCHAPFGQLAWTQTHRHTDTHTHTHTLDPNFSPLGQKLWQPNRATEEPTELLVIVKNPRPLMVGGQQQPWTSTLTSVWKAVSVCQDRGVSFYACLDLKTASSG